MTAGLPDGSSRDRADFKALIRYARATGRPRPGRVVGGPLRAFYIDHPDRVQIIRGRQMRGPNDRIASVVRPKSREGRT